MDKLWSLYDLVVLTSLTTLGVFVTICVFGVLVFVCLSLSVMLPNVTSSRFSSITICMDAAVLRWLSFPPIVGGLEVFALSSLNCGIGLFVPFLWWMLAEMK